MKTEAEASLRKSSTRHLQPVCSSASAFHRFCFDVFRPSKLRATSALRGWSLLCWTALTMARSPWMSCRDVIQLSCDKPLHSGLVSSKTYLQWQSLKLPLTHFSEVQRLGEIQEEIAGHWSCPDILTELALKTGHEKDFNKDICFSGIPPLEDQHLISTDDWKLQKSDPQLFQNPT